MIKKTTGIQELQFKDNNLTPYQATYAYAQFCVRKSWSCTTVSGILQFINKLIVLYCHYYYYWAYNNLSHATIIIIAECNTVSYCYGKQGQGRSANRILVITTLTNQKRPSICCLTLNCPWLLLTVIYTWTKPEYHYYDYLVVDQPQPKEIKDNF